MMLRLRRARDRGQRGAAAVEFALVMLPLLYLVFGIIQYGLYFYGMNSGQAATSDAVRRLVVGDCTNQTELKTFLKTRMGAATPTAASSIVTAVAYKDAAGADVGTPAIGGSVKLTVSYFTHDVNFPFIPIPGEGASEGLITREVFGRVEDTVASTGGCL